MVLLVRVIKEALKLFAFSSSESEIDNVVLGVEGLLDVGVVDLLLDIDDVEILLDIDVVELIVVGVVFTVDETVVAGVVSTVIAAVVAFIPSPKSRIQID